MIRKYTYGNPFPTEAVVQDLPCQRDPLPYFTIEGDRLTLSLEEEAPVYGLGEQVRGINKRGWLYISNASDDPHHLESTHSLYGAHNFLLIGSLHPFGIFIDYPGTLTFDIGYTRRDKMYIQPSEWDLDIYIIESPDDRLTSIVRLFRQLTGKSYLPPKWAFGYGQSRWGYQSESDIRTVAGCHREAGIPLDAIYMDIDYMACYKDFTVSGQKFPDLPALTEDMQSQGIHLVPIIDAGVKIEDSYSVYEEGVQNDYFCKEKDGGDFVGAVWPGRVHFPDVLNPKARRWFGLNYKYLLDMGIDGFWNDMNEPAIFYSEKRLQKVLDQISDLKGENLDLDKNNELLGLVNTLANNPEDYRSFYHKPGDGLEPVRHDKVHNLYGYNMTRAAAEAFDELEPDRRILLFSRSSYIGMHRYGGIWQGDNMSWWSHLLMNIKMMPSLNMCGFLYTGADLGGFGADTTEDLLLRWLQFGIFTPLMRNHSAMGTREQEAYQFSNAEALKNIIKLRYCLLPYLYSEYMKAALMDGMLFRPLAFDYPKDRFASKVEDQLLLGDGLMLCPIYQQNAEGRYVYLPEDMLLITASGPDDIRFAKMSPGHHYIEAALSEVVFFLRKGHILPLAAAADCVKNLDVSHLTLISYLGGSRCTYQLYDDDGISKNCALEGHIETICVNTDGTAGSAGNSTRTFDTKIF